MKIISRLFFILSSLFLFSIQAQQRIERLALVIGNADYQEGKLTNPINDVRAIGTELEELGFKVIKLENANQEEMENAIQQFGKKLNPQTVGLFYFSGHSMQYNGQNYLIPIQAMKKVNNPDQLRYKTVEAGYILAAMKNSGSGLNLFFLDACRNNPFKNFSRNVEKGLAKMNYSAEGILIAYATAPGKVAYDGDGKHSPYTASLLKWIKEPNLPVEQMLKKVRSEVKKQTGNKQSPWYEASIEGNFYFKKLEEKAAPPNPSVSNIVEIPSTPQNYLLTVRSNVYDDQVFINGQLVGSTKLEKSLPAGEYTITVKKSGYSSYSETIHLNENQIIKANLREKGKAKLHLLSKKKLPDTDPEYPSYYPNYYGMIDNHAPEELKQLYLQDKEIDVYKHEYGFIKSLPNHLWFIFVNNQREVGLYDDLKKDFFWKINLDDYIEERPLQNPQKSGDFDSIVADYTLYKDGILYFNAPCDTDSFSLKGKCGALYALDPIKKKKLWKSDFLVSNSTFIILDRFILSTYGFTKEPDYVYLLDRETGKTLDRFKVDTKPGRIVIRENKLYVLTYNYYEYVFALPE